jgi:Holliday junction DNA helicase RuvB
VSAALRLVPSLSASVMTVASSRQVPETDNALRPQTFAEYIGQREVIENIGTSVRAAARGKFQMDHMLFTGPAGLGKTSLAQVVANELGVKIRITSAPAITHRGELASLLTSLSSGDVLFIDEIHRLSATLQETLYMAMEDGVLDMAAGQKVIRVPLPKFTLLGATTHAGMLSGPLMHRFGFVWQLKFYAVSDLTTIVLRSATKLGIAIDESGATEIARRSRGTPRLANRLLRRVRDFVLGADTQTALTVRGGLIGGPLAMAALERLGVDRCGLDAIDRAYLAATSKGPVGIEAIASALSEQRCTIEDVVEPYLMQIGFVSRTSRGRVATDAGKQHLSGLAL